MSDRGERYGPGFSNTSYEAANAVKGFDYFILKMWYRKGTSERELLDQQRQLRLLDKEIRKLLKQIETLTRRKNRFDKDAERLEKKAAAAAAKLAELKKAAETPRDSKRLAQRVGRAEKEAERLKTRADAAQQAAEAAQSTITAAKEELQKLQQKRDRLNAEVLAAMQQPEHDDRFDPSLFSDDGDGGEQRNPFHDTSGHIGRMSSHRKAGDDSSPPIVSSTGAEGFPMQPALRHALTTRTLAEGKTDSGDESSDESGGEDSPPALPVLRRAMSRTDGVRTRLFASGGGGGGDSDDDDVDDASDGAADADDQPVEGDGVADADDADDADTDE
jgi:hypothetical protein